MQLEYFVSLEANYPGFLTLFDIVNAPQLEDEELKPWFPSSAEITRCPSASLFLSLQIKL